MQTWEYSPEYSIRSYAFLLPFYLIGSFFKLIFKDKTVIFYSIRVCIGLFSFYCQYLFYGTVMYRVNREIGQLLRLLFYSAAGIHFYSTCLLPSAICTNLFMLAVSSYVRGKDLNAIFWGCIAVCCTGWPFVGVVFAPMGLHMMSRQISITQLKQQRMKEPFSIAPCIGAIFALLMKGAFILFCVVGATVLIDSYMYQKW